MYNYVRSRQLEGTFPGDKSTGSWPISCLRIFYGWGAIDESLWQYDQTWPPNFPQREPEFDKIACTHRIAGYSRVRNLTECKIWLSQGKPVTSSFFITNDWFSVSTTGRIPTYTLPTKFIGAHCVCIIGYDDTSSTVTIQNSWGSKWGDNGFCSMTYDQFNSSLIEAWLMNTLTHPSLCYEIKSPDDDAVIGWIFYIPKTLSIEVEELFVKPNYRKKGFGRKLVQKLFGEATPIIIFWIPLGDNKENVEIFFKKLGYQFSIEKVDHSWAHWKLTLFNPDFKKPQQWFPLNE